MARRSSGRAWLPHVPIPKQPAGASGTDAPISQAPVDPEARFGYGIVPAP